jgi:serine phosphatase RsbU (regulator of sigma subunit)
LEKERVVIGRLPSCDVVLEMGSVSRQHCQILRIGEEFYVEDLGARNGSFVNGQRVEGRRKLADGDELKVGDALFRFYAAAPEAAAAGGRPPGMSSNSSWAELIDEEKAETPSSTIMSKIDAGSGATLRVSVNPEAKLKALIEISKSLASSLGEEQVLQKILDSLFRVFPQADRGFIILRESPSSPLIPKAVKYRRHDQDDTVRVSRTVVNQVMATKEAILSADAASDSRFSMSESIADFRIRSMMCVPLINSEGDSIGILQIDTLDQRSRFQEDDLEVLVSVASQAAFSIENAQLHQQAIWQESLKRDLSLARQVQQGFLPRQTPEIAGYEFFHFYEPASQVGGDFFDYILLPGNRLAVIVADVSGKGVAAALLMAKVTSEARYQLVSSNQPAEAVNRLSQAFASYGWSERFVTFVMAVVDYVRHEVVLVNAGHMAPLLRRTDGTVAAVAEHISGVPLGVDPDWEYEEFHFTLQPGEILTAFTDGFSEAENVKRELYGMERLVKQVAGPVKGVTELGQRILSDVKQHASSHRQSDDMCLLCFGRTA